MSAWADQNELILGQIKVEEKSNEITTIPQLLDTLLLKGCIVTIDAMRCQKKIARKIVAEKAEYILATKENQKDFSNLNRIALNLLKKDDTKVGIKSHRKMAGWGNDYLLKLNRE